jgi:hypothetical protein
MRYGHQTVCRIFYDVAEVNYLAGLSDPNILYPTSECSALELFSPDFVALDG